MLSRRRIALFLLTLLALAAFGRALADDQKKDEKKSGTVTGVVTAKEKNSIEVKADGEEKARRYVPHWRGGNPNEGGGPDKKMVEEIGNVKIGSRVRLEWEFEERPRVVKIEVLRAPAGSETAEKRGTVTGTLTAKVDNGIEVKADGEERARRYAYHRGGTPELKQTIKDIPVGSRVRVEWFFLERPRVEKIEVLRAGKDKG